MERGGEWKAERGRSKHELILETGVSDVGTGRRTDRCALAWSYAAPGWYGACEHSYRHNPQYGEAFIIRIVGTALGTYRVEYCTYVEYLCCRP